MNLICFFGSFAVEKTLLAEFLCTKGAKTERKKLSKSFTEALR